MTRRAYIFVYAEELGDREALRDFLDRLPEVLNWRYDLPNAFYLVSESSADELANKIKLVGTGRFIITEVPENSQGWLPRRSWDIITQKALPDAEGERRASQLH